MSDDSEVSRKGARREEIGSMLISACTSIVVACEFMRICAPCAFA